MHRPSHHNPPHLPARPYNQSYGAHAPQQPIIIHHHHQSNGSGYNQYHPPYAASPTSHPPTYAPPPYNFRYGHHIRPPLPSTNPTPSTILPPPASPATATPSTALFQPPSATNPPSKPTPTTETNDEWTQLDAIPISIAKLNKLKFCGIYFSGIMNYGFNLYFKEEKSSLLIHKECTSLALNEDTLSLSFIIPNSSSNQK
eukprot:30407_1